MKVFRRGSATFPEFRASEQLVLSLGFHPSVISLSTWWCFSCDIKDRTFSSPSQSNVSEPVSDVCKRRRRWVAGFSFLFCFPFLARSLDCLVFSDFRWNWSMSKESRWRSRTVWRHLAKGENLKPWNWKFRPIPSSVQTRKKPSRASYRAHLFLRPEILSKLYTVVKNK